MKIRAVITFAALVASNLALAGTLEDAEFCGTAIGVSESSKGLAQYSDKQIESGVCMTTRIVVDLITNEANDTAINGCTRAVKLMLDEFARRFPSRNAKEVLGRC